MLTLSCFIRKEQQIWKFQLDQISPLYCYVTVYPGGHRDCGKGMHRGNAPVKNNTYLFSFQKGNLIIYIHNWWN